jgi:predicted metal-dependent phosphoesterase TrpH
MRLWTEEDRMLTNFGWFRRPEGRKAQQIKPNFIVSSHGCYKLVTVIALEWCMRCDLHVHTVHSGMTDFPGLGGICRECYTDPLALYSHLKGCGMDLVTVTDHDSIDAAEALREREDFFLSEEVSCVMPGGARFHVGVYNINERQHVELQRRRDDLPRFLAYLREQSLFFSVNHPLSRLTGRRDAEDLEWWEREFPAFEVRNGHMPAESNRRAQTIAEIFGKAGLGGSDAHTLASAGTTFTEVAGARSKQDFLSGLAQGHGRAAGDSGNYWKLTQDVLIIAGSMMRERHAAAILAPLTLTAPLVTLVNWVLDISFGRRWADRWSAPIDHRIAVPARRALNKAGSVVT